jgi:hypothetical protein
VPTIHCHEPSLVGTAASRADVCPVGADYAAMLRDALEAIPEDTPAKEARVAAMDAQEKAGHLPDSYAAQRRWIGTLPTRGS